MAYRTWIRMSEYRWVFGLPVRGIVRIVEAEVELMDNQGRPLDLSRPISWNLCRWYWNVWPYSEEHPHGVSDSFLRAINECESIAGVQ